VWRWALCVELGLSQQQLSRLAAVLLVHQDMTAAEVSSGSCTAGWQGPSLPCIW
jgi:hypothetical protein